MSPEPEIAELELRDYLRVLRRRLRLILLVTVVIVAALMGSALLQEPTYDARARVLIQAREGQGLFDARALPIRDPNRLVQTEVLVFDSPQLKEDVRRRIGSAPPVAAFQVAQTDVIEIVAKSSEAERAAAVANAYADAYIGLRRAQAVDDVVSAAEQIQAKISDLQRQIDTAEGEQQNALIDQQAVFRQKLDQLQVDNALQRGGARLVSTASPPRSPESPAVPRTVVIGLAFGLMTGIGLALALEYMDDSIRTAEDIERVAPGTGVVGMIPAVQNWRSTDDPVVASLDDPRSAAAEAFRTLRTSLQFLFLGRPIGVVQVTSPNAGEGKSATVANLGVALASTGRRVVIVDCDLRRPRLNEFCGVDGGVGLTSVLVGDVSLAAAVVEVPGVSRLSVLPAGPLPPNPSELLAAPRTADLIASLQAGGTAVILDSPPLLPVTDALVLSARADATLIVCRTGQTTRKQARRAIELLRQVQAPLAGVVLNGVPEDDSYRGSYGYSNEPRGRPRSRMPA